MSSGSATGSAAYRSGMTGALRCDDSFLTGAMHYAGTSARYRRTADGYSVRGKAGNGTRESAVADETGGLRRHVARLPGDTAR